MFATIAVLCRVSLTAIGVLCTTIVALSIYLMYFDPETFQLAAENLDAFVNNVNEIRATRSITINY